MTDDVTDFMAYGGFTDPVTKVNFIVVRHGRTKKGEWRKLCAAINTLIKPWKDDDGTRSKKVYWNVDGDPTPGSLWSNSKSRRYEWIGEALVEVAGC